MSMTWKEAKAEGKVIKDANRVLTKTYQDELRAYKKAQKDHTDWLNLPEEEQATTLEPTIPPEPIEPTLADLPDWRDQWKYGNKVRGIGNCDDKPCIDWGPAITPEERTLIETLVTLPTKWADKIERILDNPPTPEDLELLKRIKPLLS